MTYTNIVCVVTDTEPTTVKAGCILKSYSAEQGRQLGWHVCTDHIGNFTLQASREDSQVHSRHICSLVADILHVLMSVMDMAIFFNYGNRGIPGL